jgi:predicted GNAT family acetyltransferase
LPETIQITRSDETTHGAYSAELSGTDETATLTWVARGPLRIANHTYVPPELRGRGIAQALVEAMVADAREQGFKIVPQCSYVEALFGRHPDWDDVRAR